MFHITTVLSHDVVIVNHVITQILGYNTRYYMRYAVCDRYIAICRTRMAVWGQECLRVFLRHSMMDIMHI